MTSLLDLQPIVGTTNDDGDDDALRCDLLQMGWLSLLISSGIRTNYCIFVKSFPCFGYLENFFVSVGSSKTLHGLSFFVSCSSVFSMPL